MLSIDINRDIEKYEEAVIAGFNGKKSLALVACVGIGGGLGFLMYYKFHVNMNLIALIIIPILSPIILVSFGTKDGMTFKEQLDYRLHHKRGYIQNKSSVLNAVELKEIDLLKAEADEKKTAKDRRNSNAKTKERK